MTKLANGAILSALSFLLALSAGAQAPDPETSDEAGPGGIYALLERVAAESAAADSAADDDNCPGLVDLCLHDGLFGVWGQLGDADNFVNTKGRPLQGTKQGGVLYAYSDDNPELLVKVLNGCKINKQWWVYIGTATDQPFFVAIKHFPSDDTASFMSSDIPLRGEAKIDVWPCEP